MSKLLNCFNPFLISFNIISDSGRTECTSSYNGSFTQNLKIRPVFEEESSPIAELTEVSLTLKRLMLNGVGESFPNLEILSIIDLSDLFSLEKRHFENMPNLKKLSIFDIESISEDAFDNLSNLEEINLYWSKELEGENFFKSMVNLKRIQLKFPSEHFVIGEVLKGLENLESIIIYGGNIETLERSIVANLFRVRKIEFENCKIKEITEDAFQDLTSVEELILSSNEFEYLAEKTFWNLKTLLKLSLSGNPLKMLPATLFRDLTNLIDLNLSYLEITSVNESLFDNLKNLTELSLTNNPIVSLHENTFKSLVNLEALKLDYCKIERISAGLFDHNLALTSITLYENSLKTIEFDFTKLPELNYISLNGNVCVEELSAYARFQIEEVQNVITSNCTQV